MSSDIQSLHQLPAGTVLKDRYQIDAVLGEGGFGITYKGTDRMLEMTVAVKEFYPHGYAVRNSTAGLQVTLISGHGFFDQWRDRFLTEARTLAKCTNVPGIVQVRDFFEENNTAYIVMEYLSGISLQDYILQNGIIPAGRMFSYMLPLIRDLDSVHQLGLVHRDISPDNIMLMPNDTLKLFDFGAARYVSDEEHRTMSIMLKPGYAPEEQYRSKGIQGPWTDIYAICATIYKCITGITPPDSLERINEDELRAPSELGCGISACMEQVLLKGMSIHASDRFQDAASLADAMEACMKDPASESSATQTVTVIMEDPEEEATEEPAKPEADSASGKGTSSDTSPAPSSPGKQSAGDEASGTPGTDRLHNIKEKASAVQETSNHISGKKNRKLLWILAAVIVAAAVLCVLLLTGNRNPKPDSSDVTQGAADAQTATAEPAITEADAQAEPAGQTVSEADVQTEPDGQADTGTELQKDTDTAVEIIRMTDGDYAPVSGTALLDSVLWGVHYYAGDKFFSSSTQFMDITTDRGTLNVSRLPIAFLVNPAWKDEPVICLCFMDQFQYLYFIYGTYQSQNQTLRISAVEHPEALPQFHPSDILDNTYSLNEGNYICEAGTSYPAEGTAYLLQDTIELSWDLESGTSGLLRLKSENRQVSYESGFLSSENGRNRILHLQGTASDPNRTFKEMKSLDLTYDSDAEKGTVTICYADGGQSLDAAVSTYYSNIHNIGVKTTQISRPYNGRTETFSENKTLSFYYINTYPYGFILYDSNGNKEYYYYQMPN